MRGQEADPGRRNKPGGGNLVLDSKLYTLARTASNARPADRAVEADH